MLLGFERARLSTSIFHVLRNRFLAFSIERLFAMVVVIGLFTGFVRETVDPDMWWHLRTGEYIWNNGIPRQDIFSHTVPHHTWITHEWLSEVVMWAIYQFGGLPALSIGFAIVLTCAFLLVYLCADGRPYVAGFVVLLAALTSLVNVGTRPHMFNILFLAVYLYILEGYRKDGSNTRTLILLPFLTAIWANLHSGFMLGIVLIATYAVGELLQAWLDEQSVIRRRKQVRNLGLAALLCLLGAVLNPNGYHIWTYPFLTLNSAAMQEYILEWHSPDFHDPAYMAFGAMLAVVVLVWVWSRERPSATDILLVMGTAAAGLLSTRHIPVFAVVATPVISRALTHYLADTRFSFLITNKQHRRFSRSRTILNVTVLLVVLFIGVLHIQHRLDNNEVEIAHRYPVTAVDFLLESGLADKNGYNSYYWGGYLIWRGIPVFIDGRADVYGDSFIYDYLVPFQAQENWNRVLDTYDVDYVLIERQLPLVSVLSVSSDWQEVYADDIAEVFIRSDMNSTAYK